jgi:acyl-CoA thioesterase II
VDTNEFLGMSRRAPNQWSFKVDERLSTPRKFLFGGCGLAAGIVALEEASERPTIWASAQYLSYALVGAEVNVTTELAVVGANVTQARATAYVEDREILTINAAMGTGHLNALAPSMVMPDAPDPEGCEPLQRHFDIKGTIFQHLDCRVALHRTANEEDSLRSGSSAIWAKIPGHADPSAATLAIFGDIVSGGVIQLTGQPTMGRSLDNTLRVATLVATEWVLLEINMHALVNGFAQGTGFLWSQSGTLLASASQSIAAKLR